MQYSFDVPYFDGKRIYVRAKSVILNSDAYRYENYRNYVNGTAVEFNDGNFFTGIDMKFRQGNDYGVLMFYACPFLGQPIAIVSSQFSSPETSEKVLEEFTKFTESKETDDIPKEVVEFYKAYEIMYLKLLRQRTLADMN